MILIKKINENVDFFTSNLPRLCSHCKKYILQREKFYRTYSSDRREVDFQDFHIECYFANMTEAEQVESFKNLLFAAYETGKNYKNRTFKDWYEENRVEDTIKVTVNLVKRH